MERRSRPMLVFVLLSFGISWGAVWVLQAIARASGLPHFGALLSLAENSPNLGTIAAHLSLPVSLVYLLTRLVDFGPSLAGLITPLLVGHPIQSVDIVRRLADWRIPLRWYLVACALPLVLVTVAWALTELFSPGAAGPMQWHGWATLANTAFWVLVARTPLGGGLGEELGWRGFALPHLTVSHGAVRASLLLGLLWTAWHLPIHLISPQPLIGLVAQALYTLPLSFVFTWLALQVEGRLLPVVLMHGALNGFSTLFERVLFPRLLESDTFVALVILVVLIAGLVAAARLWRTRRQYGRVSGPA